jgi:phosphoribosylformimino-5-aminoimidazole carboxamide ribotide isomerase
MRLIPVIDLLNGEAVHAVRGERENYKPVKSIVCDKSDPLSVAGAFRDRLGLREIYIADLNAIQGSPEADHRDLIASLVHNEKMKIMLDAGIPDIAPARRWLGLGVHKVIIGSETLSSLDALREIIEGVDRDRLVFSLDMRADTVLSKCSDFAALSPLEALEQLQASGWRDVILLDVSRVGSEGGFDRALVAEARKKCPRLNLLIGGGIANPGQLLELKSLQVAGVLIATAFHRGIITARHVSEISDYRLSAEG